MEVAWPTEHAELLLAGDPDNEKGSGMRHHLPGANVAYSLWMIPKVTSSTLYTTKDRTVSQHST